MVSQHETHFLWNNEKLSQGWFSRQKLLPYKPEKPEFEAQILQWRKRTTSPKLSSDQPHARTHARTHATTLPPDIFSSIGLIVKDRIYVCRQWRCLSLFFSPNFQSTQNNSWIIADPKYTSRQNSFYYFREKEHPYCSGGCSVFLRVSCPKSSRERV